LALALAFSGGCIAGAHLAFDGQAHFGNGRREIAGDVDGERFEGRDVERVQAAARGVGACAAGGERDEARQETGKRFAGAGGGNEERGAARGCLFDEGQLVGARLPAFGCEPAGEGFGQERRGQQRGCRPGDSACGLG